MNFIRSFLISWRFLINCFRFFLKNKDLVFFPLISLILNIALLFILFAGGILEFKALTHIFNQYPWVSVSGFVLLYFFFCFVVIYFNAALIACATLRLQGQFASIGEGLGLAAKHWWPLLQWTLLSTTVGLIIRVLENSHNRVQEIIGLILGLSWNLSTYFVIPIMVFQNVGLFKALKTGFSIFGRGWQRILSIVLVFHVLTLILLAVFYGLIHLYPLLADTSLNLDLLFEIGVPIALLVILIIAIIGHAFNGIANSALYLSYVEKNHPIDFDRDLLKQAFSQKPRGRFRLS